MADLFSLVLLALASSALPTVKHIVMIIVDDLGHSDLGFRGSEVKTPVLDGLARGGVELQPPARPAPAWTSSCERRVCATR